MNENLLKYSFKINENPERYLAVCPRARNTIALRVVNKNPETGKVFTTPSAIYMRTSNFDELLSVLQKFKEEKQDFLKAYLNEPEQEPEQAKPTKKTKTEKVKKDKAETNEKETDDKATE